MDEGQKRSQALLPWIAILSVSSLLVMALIDRALGSRAEFLNAWSVFERLLGREPSAGASFVALRIGALGELLAVLLANTAVGTVLAFVFGFGLKLFR